MGWMPQDLHLHQHALEPDIPEEIQGSVSPAYGSLDGQNTIRRLLHAGATAHGVWAGVVERMKGRVVLSEDHIVDEIDVKTIVVELLKERVAKTRAAAKQWLRFWRRRRRARERSASASTRGVSPTATFREEMIPEHLPAGDLFAREDTPSEIPEELGANPQLLSTYRTDRTATTDIMDPYTPLTPTRGPVPHEVPVPVSPLRILIPKRREGAKASCTPYVPIDQANPPLPSVIVPRKQPQFPAGQAARRPVSGQGQRGGGATEVSSSCVLTEGAQSPAAVGRLRRLVRGGRPGDDAWLGSGTATPASSSGDMSPARSLSPSPAGRTVPQGRGPVAPVEGKVKVPGEEELEFLALLKEPEDPLQGVRLPASLSPSPGDKPGSRPLTPPSSTPAGRGRAPSADDLEFMTWCQGVQGPGVGHAAKTGPLKHNSTGSHAAPRKPRGHQRKTSSSSLPEAGPMEKRQPRGYCSPTPPVAGAPQIARSNYAGTPPPPARGGTKSSPPKPMRRPSDSADQLSLERRNSGVIKPKPDRGAMVMPKIAPVNNHAERRHFPARASSSKLFG
eukprot:TRINITY_DN1121_c5_g1_i2.p1 TRINITY_DN1121_c5_g1~~TRINITY_DN1121_c5_g1_i2.p1  ORF type:complete len:562 (+),score=173.81 TRINITY_DN1121_c5_g1_i2:48-1733(+)